MIRVSVIIPAYNAAAFVREAVDSALAQTHAGLEVIVINDGSTDDTPQVLAEYGSRIRVHHQVNHGLAPTRNIGAGLATGEWIAFLDADDRWLPRKIERQLDAVGGCAWSYTNRFNFGTRGSLPELQSDATEMTGGDVFAPLLLRGNFITVSSVMIQKTVFERVGGFYHQKGGCEDWDLWLRVSGEGHPVSYVPEPLVSYRFTPTSMSANHRAMAPARLAVVARALDSARGQSLDWRVRRRIWGETHRTNGWDAGRSGSRGEALAGYARAAWSWPLSTTPYQEALKVCLHG